MQRPTSRREFLAGRSAVEALADAAEKLLPPLPAPESTQRTWLVQISREAMACEFEILLNARQYPAGPDAAVAALDLVETLEAQLTVYRETSEVSRLNQRADERPVIVEEGLFQLLQQAKELFAATGGAFDITSGPLSRIWGFYRRQGQMPSQEAVDTALEKIGSNDLLLDPQARSVRFMKPGMELNLGAIGKGYTLDRCAALLAREGVHDFVIHGGNSSVLARGNRSQESGVRCQESEGGVGFQPARNQETGDRVQDTEIKSQIPNPKSQISNLKSQTPGGSPAPRLQPPAPNSSGWSVGLRHPLRPDERLAEFTLRNQALGTSGSGTQFFHYQGKRYGHILDPRTGWPAEEVLSATVIAPTAALADALSTAFYVLGLDGAQRYCNEHPEISALLVTPRPRSTAVDLHPINLANNTWQLL